MQQFQLTIPEPCHQSWQQMTPTQQGRFCNACAKEVIDFSMMSDAEVLHYFNNLSHENVCGRALPSQLERTIALPKDPVKKRFWYWNYITLFFLLFSKNGNAKPHGGIIITSHNKNLFIDPAVDLQFKKASKNKFWVSKTIAGKITDEKGRGIPFVTVTVKGTSRSVQSDEYGVYSIKVNPSTGVLEIKAKGYGDAIFMLSGLSIYNFTLSVTASKDIVVFAGKMIARPAPGKRINVFEALQITGNVKDGIGNAIPYASVKISNSHNGISADSMGNFSIRVNDINSIVEISAVGFKNKSIVASDADGFKNIILENTIDQTLLPVVVVGYQTQGLLRCTVGGISVVRRSVTRSLTDTLKDVFTFKKNAVKVYPSPVTRGNLFNIAVTTKQPGDYFVQVIDAQGRVLLKEKAMLNAKQQTIQVHADEKWSAGIYYIRVINTNNTLLSTISFSVQ